MISNRCFIMTFTTARKQRPQDWHKYDFNFFFSSYMQRLFSFITFLPYPLPTCYTSFHQRIMKSRERSDKKQFYLMILWNVTERGLCYLFVANHFVWRKENSIHSYSIIQWPWQYLQNILSSKKTLLFCITKCRWSLYMHKYSINVLYLFVSRLAM